MRVRESGLDAKSGFTLVELLIVLAIVSVVSAILFPVFASAKRKAQATRCAGNLRQIYAGSLLYAGDADGLAPSGPTTASECGRGHFRYDEEPAPAERRLARYLSTREVWRCPAETFSGILDGDFQQSPSESAFDLCGSSYWYRVSTSEAGMRLPGRSDVALAFDSGDHHLGAANFVFADGHLRTTAFARRTEFSFGDSAL